MKKFKIITSLLLTSMILTGCGNSKLEDGKELVLEMDGIKLSANDFYTKLKDKYGIATLVDQMDMSLLEKEYETSAEMKTQIESQILSVKEQSGSDFNQAIKYYYGVNTERELYSYIEMTLKKELAVRDYATAIITEDDIKKYYDERAIGDIKASHILIKPTVTDTMTDAEKEEADKKALEKAKDIIKELDANSKNITDKFKELAKKHSADEGSATKGGDVGFFNKTEMVEEFEKEAIALKIGEYSKAPVKTKFGYHILLKVEQKEKDKLENVKDSIKTILVDEKVKNTTNINAYAMEALREEYKLKIYDAQMKIQYDNYMNTQKSQ